MFELADRPENKCKTLSVCVVLKDWRPCYITLNLLCVQECGLHVDVCNIFHFSMSFSHKAGNSPSRPAGRFCIGRSSWGVVGHRPGIGYVSSKNRGIGRRADARTTSAGGIKYV